jgi:hypothetical protein
MAAAWHAVSSEIQLKVREKGAASGSEPKTDAAAKKSGKEGDVVDADFEVVDDDKKKT